MASSSMPPAWSVSVYRDPRTMVVRYVGRGRDGRVQSRYPNGRTEKFRQWATQLELEGLAPIVETVPCRDEAEAHAVEAALIAMHWPTRRPAVAG